MSKPRSILCGGLTIGEDDPLCNGRHIVHLATRGPDANVNLCVTDVAKVFLQHVSPRLVDLLEIASYIYSTDCATRRDGAWMGQKGVEPWGRDFQLIIPVRDHHFWSRQDVSNLLQKSLQFLSQDKYNIVFRPMPEPWEDQQGYFEFKQNLEDWPYYGVDRVLMFSGGLDSLAGAIQTVKSGSHLVLVSHRPVSVQSKRQTSLFKQLLQTYQVPLIHVPVWVNKDENKSKEHTQRTRSFLYSALGVVVASSVKAGGVRFFENGIVSLNLPVADEVIGSRASRTTHPWVLDLFSRFYSLVLEREFVVDNPFQFMTKSEVVQVIAENGGEKLIGYSVSCGHQGLFRSKSQAHCGACSQCIDRRIAILAAGQGPNDPETDYVTDVFIGARKEGYQQNMAVDYTRLAHELWNMGEEEMAVRFNTELTRASRPFAKQSEAAQEFIKMHKRHGETVKRIIDEQLRAHAGRFFECSLPESSLLAKVGGQAHRASSWRRYAARIVRFLEAGLPKICGPQRPEDEPRLQQICDGILTANDEVLVREFPFMRWGSNLTKPDWSAEEFGLWIELKYVRKNRGTVQISEDIAADITKYGDSKRRVLFVVYDPDRVIVDDQAFTTPVGKREDMHIAIVR